MLTDSLNQDIEWKKHLHKFITPPRLVCSFHEDAQYLYHTIHFQDKRIITSEGKIIILPTEGVSIASIATHALASQSFYSLTTSRNHYLKIYNNTRTSFRADIFTLFLHGSSTSETICATNHTAVFDKLFYTDVNSVADNKFAEIIMRNYPHILPYIDNILYKLFTVFVTNNCFETIVSSPKNNYVIKIGDYWYMC